MIHRGHRPHGHPHTIDDLAGHVAPAFVEGAKIASEAFRQAGVPHSLVGGLAVGLLGYPRHTKDIDFLVGEEAFEHHGLVVTHRPGLPICYQGIDIDWVSLEPHERPAFEQFLIVPPEGTLPSMPAGPLVAMKLIAGRMRDRSDVVEIVKAGADVEEIREFVDHHFPENISLLEKLVKIAATEED